MAQRLARDERGDLLGLVGAADVLEVVDLGIARGLAAVEVLVDAEARLQTLWVLGDERVRRVEDPLRGTAVFDQGHDRRLGVCLPERVEVAERRAAPGEDRLVVVADDGDVAVRLDQRAEQRELRGVGVLELVDQHVPVAALKAARGRGVLAQQSEAQRDLVAEVDDPGLLLQRGVRGIDRGELLLRLGLVGADVGVDALTHRRPERRRVRVVSLGRDVLVARAAEEIEERTHVAERIAGGSVSAQRQVVQMLADEDDLLRAGEDAELAAASELERELAEHLVAETVEGLDAGVVQAERRVEVDALLHLRGGLLGEGDREDLVRFRRAGGDELDDPGGEHVRLPGAGAGDDEQRSGPVHDRAALLLGERREDVRPRLGAEPELELLAQGLAGGRWKLSDQTAHMFDATAPRSSRRAPPEFAPTDPAARAARRRDRDRTSRRRRCRGGPIRSPSRRPTPGTRRP